MRRRDTRFARMCTAALMIAAIGLQPATTGVALAQTPSFRAAVDLVSVTAVVRDNRGRPVRNLGRDDFEVYEQGQLRRLVDFKASDQGPVSLAFSSTSSGSMRVGAQMEAGQRAVEHILSWVKPGRRGGSLLVRRDLRQEVPFTNDLAACGARSTLDRRRTDVALRRHRPPRRRRSAIVRRRAAR